MDLSKKLITDNEKQCSKQEDDIQTLEAELVDLDRAWRSFEQQLEEKLLHKGRDVELENTQVKKMKILETFLFVSFLIKKSKG